MRNKLIYLDNCCFNRPFDDQTQIIIHLETISKLFIQSLVLQGKLDLVWSFMLDYEIKDNPFIERQIKIHEWEKLAVVDCDYSDEIDIKAQELMEMNIRHKDALHIAAAIVSDVDFFITTDKRLLNKNILETIIVNPIEFVRRYIYVDGY
ncbi:MAG: hypothetical protein LBC02_04435 [Planctomycetaceae bacterium]|jgi:predicted nucleic acid-binding protein|nr:hypothetical protein [Planctomycetaceae bacterium]